VVQPGARLICSSDKLVNGGSAVRFTVAYRGEDAPAFVVRFDGQVHAYLNRCSHRGVTLDWEPGHFFDRSGRYLICAVHGAHYVPDTGECAGGPCNGGLMKLAVFEKDNGVYLASSDAERM